MKGNSRDDTLCVRTKEPQRMCVGCRKKNNKNSLIRIVNSKSEVSLDMNGKKQGRGAYIHKNLDCLKIILKKRSLGRALKCKIPDEIYRLLEVAMTTDGVENE